MQINAQPVIDFLELSGLNLTESCKRDFAAIWKQHDLKRKVVLTQPGSVERRIYFVLEGVQRVFYSDDEDREATLVLTYAGSFAGVMDSFLLQKPSAYYFETLTKSSLLSTSYSQFFETVQNHPVLNMFVQSLSHQVLSGLLERMTELQCFTSEQKFRKLFERSPHILQLVPHKYLANYLGIDATNFSKLMNSVKI